MSPFLACVTRRRWRVLALVCGFLVVAAGLLGTADEARAGCGEYVLINGRPASVHHLTTSPRNVARMPFAPNKSGRPQRLPCDGPHCGQQAPLPIPVEQPTLHLRGVEQWASLLVGTDAIEPRWSPAYWFEQFSWQNALIPRLDRPPRC